MKYFTPQLLSDSNSDDISLSRKAEMQWNRNMKAYWKYVARILPKLPSQARRFFGKTSLHDATIELISLGDLGRFSKPRTSSSTSFVEIKVTHPESGDLYTLRYSCLRDVKIEYHSDRRHRYYFFEDWLYDEVLLTRDKWMRHEIMLSSGTIILLEFRRFSYKVERRKARER